MCTFYSTICLFTPNPWSPTHTQPHTIQKVPMLQTPSCPITSRLNLYWSQCQESCQTVAMLSTSFCFRFYWKCGYPHPKAPLSSPTLLLNPYIYLLSSSICCQREVSHVHSPANELHNHNNQPTPAHERKGQGMFVAQATESGWGGGWLGRRRGCGYSGGKEIESKTHFLYTGNAWSTVVGGLCRFLPFNKWNWSPERVNGFLGCITSEESGQQEFGPWFVWCHSHDSESCLAVHRLPLEWEMTHRCPRHLSRDIALLTQDWVGINTRGPRGQHGLKGNLQKAFLRSEQRLGTRAAGRKPAGVRDQRQAPSFNPTGEEEV